MLCDDERKLIQDIDTLTAKINGIDDDLKKLHNADTVAEIKTLKEDNKTIDVQVLEKAGEMLTLLRLPQNISHPLFKNMCMLKEKMDKLKLPKSTASEFFNELCLEDYCICGVKMNDDMRAKIKDNSSKYLSDDIQNAMNLVKNSIGAPLQEDYFTELDNDISSLVSRKDFNENRLRVLDSEATEENDVALAISLVGRKKDLEKDRDEAYRDLELLQDKEFNSDPTTNIPKCEEQIENIKSKLNLAKTVLDFETKSKILSEIMNKIYGTSMENLKTHIVDETNKRLKKILGEEISVDSVDTYIKIRGQRGASEGQKLSVGYTFLTSLFENAAYDVPFVIDSPCGPLDIRVRREIAKMIPALFKQIIMLITSSERLQFTDTVFRTCEDTQQYTIWKEATPTHHIVVSEDRDTFNKYHTDEEA